MSLGISAFHKAVQAGILRDIPLKRLRVLPGHPAAEDIENLPVFLPGAGGQFAHIKIPGLSRQFLSGSTKSGTVAFDEFPHLAVGSHQGFPQILLLNSQFSAYLLRKSPQLLGNIHLLKVHGGVYSADAVRLCRGQK